ncbi:MAG: hypothetical protein L0Y72_17960 [Gemmataceae bacterium]|nr:hypothetical protein [Gemmataceae bacterium]MCI0740936.1 hypothetical protein [Gemmataceae bacterium]
MHQLAIHSFDETCQSFCPLCEQRLLCVAGLHLVIAETRKPVCRSCGHGRAPGLSALLDLAKIAEQAGRRSRHLLTPSMETMLALARAAENYSAAAPRIALAGAH